MTQRSRNHVNNINNNICPNQTPGAATEKDMSSRCHGNTERQKDRETAFLWTPATPGFTLPEVTTLLTSPSDSETNFLLEKFGFSLGWPQWAGPLPHEYVISKGFVGLLVFCSVKLFFLVWLFVSLWTVRSSVNFPKRQLDLS